MVFPGKVDYKGQQQVDFTSDYYARVELCSKGCRAEGKAEHRIPSARLLRAWGLEPFTPTAAAAEGGAAASTGLDAPAAAAAVAAGAAAAEDEAFSASVTLEPALSATAAAAAAAAATAAAALAEASVLPGFITLKKASEEDFDPEQIEEAGDTLGIEVDLVHSTLRVRRVRTGRLLCTLHIPPQLQHSGPVQLALLMEVGKLGSAEPDPAAAAAGTNTAASAAAAALAAACAAAEAAAARDKLPLVIGALQVAPGHAAAAAAAAAPAAPQFIVPAGFSALADTAQGDMDCFSHCAPHMPTVPPSAEAAAAVAAAAAPPHFTCLPPFPMSPDGVVIGGMQQAAAAAVATPTPTSAAALVTTTTTTITSFSPVAPAAAAASLYRTNTEKTALLHGALRRALCTATPLSRSEHFARLVSCLMTDDVGSSSSKGGRQVGSDFGKRFPPWLTAQVNEAAGKGPGEGIHVVSWQRDPPSVFSSGSSSVGSTGATLLVLLQAPAEHAVYGGCAWRVRVSLPWRKAGAGAGAGGVEEGEEGEGEEEEEDLPEEEREHLTPPVCASTLAVRFVSPVLHPNVCATTRLFCGTFVQPATAPTSAAAAAAAAATAARPSPWVFKRLSQGDALTSASFLIFNPLSQDNGFSSTYASGVRGVTGQRVVYAHSQGTAPSTHTHVTKVKVHPSSADAHPGVGEFYVKTSDLLLREPAKREVGGGAKESPLLTLLTLLRAVRQRLVYEPEASEAPRGPARCAPAAQ
jgi:hypothetical protein